MTGDDELLVAGHGGAGGLLAVTEGGIEDADIVGVGDVIGDVLGPRGEGAFQCTSGAAPWFRKGRGAGNRKEARGGRGEPCVSENSGAGNVNVVAMDAAGEGEGLTRV